MLQTVHMYILSVMTGHRCYAL